MQQLLNVLDEDRADRDLDISGKDRNSNTITNASSLISEKDAAQTFVDTVKLLQAKYGFVLGQTKWCFATNAVSNNCTHLNAMLDRHGHPSLVNLLGVYSDILSLNIAKQIYSAISSDGAPIRDLIKRDSNFPKKSDTFCTGAFGAQNTQASATFIGDCWFYYLTLAAQEQVKLIARHNGDIECEKIWTNVARKESKRMKTCAIVSSLVAVGSIFCLLLTLRKSSHHNSSSSSSSSSTQSHTSRSLPQDASSPHTSMQVSHAPISVDLNGMPKYGPDGRCIVWL
jgi:hypothetical protein